MQILQRRRPYFKTTIAPKRLIYDVENGEHAETAAEKQYKTPMLPASADILDQQIQKSGAASVDRAIRELQQEEAIMLDSKKEPKTKPEENPDEIGAGIDQKIKELISQKAQPESFITAMKSFIAGLAITKIINMDKKDRKNYDRTVQITGKNIHIFIKHKSAQMEYGVNEV